jgi:hypothetical protein
VSEKMRREFHPEEDDEGVVFFLFNFERKKK